MTIAILKLSYNKAGESPVTGGICGSAFAVGRHTVITAHHILSTRSFKPNDAYRSCQYWLLSRSGAVYELSRTQLIDCPDVDTTIIKFSTKVDMQPLQLSRTAPFVGEAVYNEGFVADAMPDVKATWGNKRLRITGHSLVGVMFDQKGFIRNVSRITLKSNDVNLNNVEVIETSYPGGMGMSGGPLMRAETGEVIGLMSFGLPPDTPIKQTVAAVSIGEIPSVVELR